jgi:hypothetical protein
MNRSRRSFKSVAGLALAVCYNFGRLDGARLAINLTPQTCHAQIFGRLFESSEFAQLESEIKAGRRTVVVSGLAGSARALVLTALEKKLGRRVIFVARSNREVEEFQPDVDFFFCALNGVSTSDQSVLAIPAVEADPYDGTSLTLKCSNNAR